MTSIDNIKNSKDTSNISVLNFLNGERSSAYVVPEEKGFITTGNIGALLNTSSCHLDKIYDGIVLNTRNNTDHSDTFIGRIKSSRNDWTELKQQHPETPKLYCNEQQLSELLPYYPNTESEEQPYGIPNVLLNPNCNMQISGVAAPQVYGGTSAFVNNPSVLNNPYNDIGHELQAYGIAENNGLRVLSQSKVSCDKLGEGLNVPNLRVHSSNTGAYIASPYLFHPDFPLYSVGDWTTLETETPNFLQEFNNNAGKSCKNNTSLI